jgi:methyl-accepting chemotaxis protein
VGKEICGVAYYSIAYPITYEDDVIGGLVIAVPAEMMSASEKLQDMAHELASSMEQISASIENIASAAQLLAENGQSVTGSSQDIHQKAEEMEEVVQYIDSVASDTKLLGLNASIEAATAGEAGKGFSVVANEVKELAKQTAMATQKISLQIEEIQDNTNSAVKAIDTITNVIEQVNSISITISSSVEEQSATVNEISKNIAGANTCAKEVAYNVTESAEGLKEITNTLSNANQVVSDTSKGVTQINLSAVKLAKLAAGLESIVKQFKV